MSGFSEVDVGRSAARGGTTGTFLRVTVQDPVKQNEGINAFITYKVNTQTDRPEFQYGQTSVIRRYREFEWLHSKLLASHPGCIIPPLPEKSLVGRFETSFVETRRRALERFVNRVSKHPELSASKHLVTFLQGDDGALAAAKEETKKALAPQPKKMMASLSLAFNQVQHTFNQNVEIPKSANDAVFDEIGTYLNALETQFLNVHKETGALIKKQRDLADTFFQFGLSLTLLGQNEVAGLGDALRSLGQAADTLSVTSSSEAEQEILHLEEPISEYCRIVGAVKAALHKRHEAKVAYHHALMELETRKTTRDKLSAQAGKEDKAAAAESLVSKAQQAADDAKTEFDTVSERFLREFERFKSEKGEEMKKLMVEYVKLQMAYHKKVDESWSALLPKLEAADVSTPPAADGK